MNPLLLSLLLLLLLLLLPLQTRADEPLADCVAEASRTAADQMSLAELRAGCQQQQTLARQLAEQPAASPLDRRLQAEQKAIDNPFKIAAYRPNYLLLASYNNNPNEEPWDALYPDQELNPVEVKFQLSMKALVARGVLGGELWGAYTQKSWWQLYSTESAPFRETNYEPELFLHWHAKGELGGLTLRGLSFGFNHQSNGRGGELSRSWNRLIASTVLERGNLVLVPRIWWRLPESAETDDNPDIDDYLGAGDLGLAYRDGTQLYTLLLQNNLQRHDNRTSIQLDWSFPVGDRVRGYVQYYDGYGESLIDYNHRNQRIGIGIVLNDWL